MAVKLLDDRQGKDKCADNNDLPSRSIQGKMQHGINIKHSGEL